MTSRRRSGASGDRQPRNRGADDLAWALDQALEGQPVIPYQGCGLGLLVHVREGIGEDPAPIGETLALREEERREGRLLDVTHGAEG
jgi:hypothetical protein